MLARWRIHLDLGDPTAVRARHLRAVAAFLAEDPGTPHDASRKPYTVMPLFEDGHGDAALELTTLTDASARHLKRTIDDVRADGGLLDHLGPAADAQLLERPVELLDRTTYHALMETAPDTTRHRFRLLTPVTFASEPFPTPRRFYGHLRALWDRFAPDDCTFRLDLADVTVHSYELLSATMIDGYRTSRGRYVDRERLGSIGWVAFDTDEYGHDDRRRLAALAAYADFAGVGGATSMGMGVVRHELAT